MEKISEQRTDATHPLVFNEAQFFLKKPSERPKNIHPNESRIKPIFISMMSIN